MYIYSIDLEEDANRVRDDGADTEDKCTRRSENDNEAKEVGEQEVAVHVQAPTFRINIIQCNDIDCCKKKKLKLKITVLGLAIMKRAEVRQGQPAPQLPLQTQRLKHSEAEAKESCVGYRRRSRSAQELKRDRRRLHLQN